VTDKELAEQTLDWVTLREMSGRKGEIKEEARRAVENAMNDGDTPLSISRKTGIPLGKVATWMLLNRHPAPAEKGTS
jgi:hypothetical protein